MDQPTQLGQDTRRGVNRIEENSNQRITIRESRELIEKLPKLVTKIEDPAKIQEAIARAKGIWSHFLYGRTARKTPETAGFSMTYDNMTAQLGLSNLALPAVEIKNAVDKIVLSLPYTGIIEEGGSYIVSDPELLFNNFGPGAIENKIIRFLSIEPNKSYSYNEIATKLDLIGNTVNNSIKKLVSKGRVTVQETSILDILGRRRYKQSLYKIKL